MQRPSVDRAFHRNRSAHFAVAESVMLTAHAINRVLLRAVWDIQIDYVEYLYIAALKQIVEVSGDSRSLPVIWPDYAPVVFGAAVTDPVGVLRATHASRPSARLSV